jgi:hypothetical protein
MYVTRYIVIPVTMELESSDFQRILRGHVGVREIVVDKQEHKTVLWNFVV